MYPVLNDAFFAIKMQPLYMSFQCKVMNIIDSIRVNESGAKIIILSNGKNTVEDIKTSLIQEYNEDREIVSDYVDNFLTILQKQNYIRFSEIPVKKTELIQLGSLEYWTPDVLMIELTENCPLRCQHCYVNAGEGASLSLPVILKLFDEAKHFSLEHLQLTGGEPLLHPNFFEILDSACNIAGAVHIFTSGYINDSLINRLKKYAGRNINIQVSIDGLPEYHDWFRGKPGAFEKTIHFIEELTSVGIRVVVATCIDKQPYEDISKLCKILKDKGVSGIRLGTISDIGRASGVLASNSERVEYVKTLKTKLAESENSSTFSIMFSEETDRRILSEYCRNCGMGQTMVKISPKGCVSPCLLSSIVYGNIINTSLLTIQKTWSRTFESICMPSHHSCNGCEYEPLCDSCVNEGLIHYPNAANCKWVKSNQVYLDRVSQLNG